MTSDDSVYRAPTSTLEKPVEGTARSLDDAIAGRFELDLGAVLQEGWARTNGAKAVILGAAAITFVVSIAGNVVTAMLSDPENVVAFSLLSMVVSLGTAAFNNAINAGSYLYAIKWVSGDESASFDDVLSCLPRMVSIFGLMLLLGLLAFVGFLLLVVPGIYLVVGYIFALPLKVERGLGIWEALETSRKAVHNDWFKVFAILLVLGVAVGMGALLTLGIGLIWLVPWATLVYATTYREIFGYSGSS